MKFELKMNKEQLEVIGHGAGKIGKAILVEGTKAVVLNTANAVITQGFTGGFGTVNELELDDLLRGGKKKEPKKGLWSFKKKTKEDGDTVETEVEVEFEEQADVIIDNEGKESEVIKDKTVKPAKTNKAK